MALADLEDLLKASMGLSAASIGSPAIARAVGERLAACRLDDPRAYLARVRGSGAELQALIEAVVVPETWFYRDRPAFTALARLAHDEWLPAHHQGVLALLSLPCSTGEEPYSMAMALLDGGVPPDRFRIDAVDISAPNVAQGSRAVYGKNSFRGDAFGFRDRHFDVTADGYRVKDNVRQQVRFQRGNLFAPDLLPGASRYDVIFCRNVLIYFARPMQDRALVILDRLLHPDGVLFVAAAETSVPASHGLVSAKEPRAFAFRKGPRAQPSAAPRAAKRVARRPATATVPAAPIVSLAAPPSPDPVPDIDQAIQLADHGHFAEAEACCEEHLRRRGPSAPAFFLMGLVRDATGRPGEAAAFYRKALYLDPNHYDSQIQLALLMEKQGDSAGAQVIRNRSRRLERKAPASHE